MPDLSPDGELPSLPPRPAPSRGPTEMLGGWLAWFGAGRLALTAFSVLIVVAGGYWLLRAPTPEAVASLPMASPGAPPPATLPPPSTVAAPTTVPAPLVVHVAGNVAAPGVYTLPPGARVVASIDAAGGATRDADLAGLNLAAPLADGQRVYVPAAGEVDPATVPSGGGAGGGAETPPAAPAGPLDLNSASAADLETLPGVGPATAAAIVDDRQRNGPFAGVDDLDRVPGIGPAKLAALRDLVTT